MGYGQGNVHKRSDFRDLDRGPSDGFGIVGVCGGIVEGSEERLRPFGEKWTCFGGGEVEKDEVWESERVCVPIKGGLNGDYGAGSRGCRGVGRGSRTTGLYSVIFKKKIYYTLFLTPI